MFGELLKRLTLGKKAGLVFAATGLVSAFLTYFCISCARITGEQVRSLASSRALCWSRGGEGVARVITFRVSVQCARDA